MLYIYLSLNIFILATHMTLHSINLCIYYILHILLCIYCIYIIEVEGHLSPADLYQLCLSIGPNGVRTVEAHILRLITDKVSVAYSMIYMCSIVYDLFMYIHSASLIHTPHIYIYTTCYIHYIHPLIPLIYTTLYYIATYSCALFIGHETHTANLLNLCRRAPADVLEGPTSTRGTK